MRVVGVEGGILAIGAVSGAIEAACEKAMQPEMQLAMRLQAPPVEFR